MLDGYAAGASVESTLRRLMAVARGDEESPPGVVELSGLVLPQVRWVVEALELADGTILNGYGAHLRQPVALTLREYVPPSYLKLRRKALQGSKGKTLVITTKQRDTLAKVARRQRCHWAELRELNPSHRKANAKLKVGTKLRVPVTKRRDRKPRGRR